MKKGLPKVVLVGRINAGKSTLFNTLTETGKAIVSSIPGTTRDINTAVIEWGGKPFTIIDTGGLDAGKLGDIEKHVQRKAYQAIQDADIAILVLDGRIEITSEDKKISLELKKRKIKHLILAINKIDSAQIKKKVPTDIYKLGIPDPVFLSAVTGSGTGDLLDIISKKLPSFKHKEKKDITRISIIGKTNVGKSSILNTLLGEERVIVTPFPHTTREPQDINIVYHGKNITLVDTAGLRKRRKISNVIEKGSVQKTLQTIKQSDVSLFVVDASEAISNQDQTIAELIIEQGKGIVFVVNKWDLIDEKDTDTMKEFTKYYQRYFAWLSWVPIVFTSAVTKQRVQKLLKIALDCQVERTREIPPEKLKLLMDDTGQKKAKPHKGKKSATLKSLTQTGIAPPKFSLAVRHPDRLNSAYLNVLEKKLRERFGFRGTPIKIIIK